MEEHGSLVARIQARMPEQIDIHVSAEDAGDVITLDGTVETDQARDEAARTAAMMAPGARLVNNLRVEEPTAPDLSRTPVGDDVAGDLYARDAATEGGGSLNPDFTDQPLDTTVANAYDEENPPEGVVFPPTDPVIMESSEGETEVLGGFAPTALEGDSVPRSALDGEPGDEAIADSVRRRLLEDASTTSLGVDVDVHRGVVYLRGAVDGPEDAENAEDVASTVPGVAEVVDELRVLSLE